MAFEIGQRVVFRSLQWEIADTSSQATLLLYGRSRENQGRKQRVFLGLEPLTYAASPKLTWMLGSRFPHWDHTAWKALHAAFRLTLAHGRGHLASAHATIRFVWSYEPPVAAIS